MARNQDYKTDLYADLRDFDKAVEYVRACAIEGALDIALRDVLAANKVPHPGLGSGALRERIAQVIVDHEHKPDDTIGRPACTCGWVSRDLEEADRPFKFDPTLFHGDHFADKIVEALSLSSPIEPSLTFEEWWERSGLLGNGPMKPVAMAAWNARPTSQASSEIRAKMMASFDKVIPSFEMRVQIVNCILRALAPSRQGAGGK